MEAVCFEKHRSVGAKSYHLTMKGRYFETENHMVLWKYKQVVCILCDRENKASGGMERAVEQQSLQLPSHWVWMRQKSEKGIVWWEL